MIQDQSKLLAQSTYRAGLIQSRAYRALHGFLAGQLEGFGLTVPEWSCLGVLFEADGSLRPSEIATELGIKQPVCTVLIKKMEHKRLVSRRLDHEDSRVTNISITKSGQKLTARIEQDLRLAMRTFLADVDRAELTVYLAVLEKIAQKG